MMITVNGKKLQVPAAHHEMSLLDYLREELDLTGAKNSCGIGVCGACTVLADDRPVKACRLRVKDVLGKRILTIEGMAAEDGSLHPLQAAFLQAGAIQCGFCTPGMVLTAHALLLRNGSPTREEIRHALQGNLCRCTGYQQIIDAVEMAAAHYRKK